MPIFISSPVALIKSIESTVELIMLVICYFRNFRPYSLGTDKQIGYTAEQLKPNNIAAIKADILAKPVKWSTRHRIPLSRVDPSNNFNFRLLLVFKPAFKNLKIVLITQNMLT